MWIKICANTNLEDAALATQLGADALGFVFAPSPRRVTPEQAAAITQHLPKAVEKIGVFDTQDFESIAFAIRTAGLTGAQLQGRFSQSLINALAAEFPGLRIFQTTHWNSEEQSADRFAERLAELRGAKNIDSVLIDSRTARASGGTGIAFDWKAARQSIANLAALRLIVAGGLKPENVQEAIAVLRPWGVDVASGVESHPGRKNPEKLAAFLLNARKPVVTGVRER